MVRDLAALTSTGLPRGSSPGWRICITAAALAVGIVLSDSAADAACRWNEAGERPGISCLPGPARLARPAPWPSQAPAVPAPAAPQRAAPLPFPRAAPGGRPGALRPPAASIPPSLPGSR